MLPAANRLKGDRNFARLRNKGRVYHSPLITLKLVKNDLEVTRFGFIVSTKAEKSAARRNRLKRRLREIIRLRLANFKTGYDVTISGKKAAVSEKYDVLEETLDSLINKTPLISKNSEKSS